MDWREARTSDPALQAELGALECLQGIASAYREAREQLPNSGPSRRDVLFRWGHLRALQELGTGSYGEVYRAWEPILAREVALKLRRPGPGTSRSSGSHYIQEARRLARVRHPNVLTILGADFHDGRIGLWTELVRGRSLEERLSEEGRLGAHEALAVGVDLCRALAAVHGAGLVHGDVKAANVLREEGGRIVLADFGAGSDLEEADLPGRMLRGTPVTTAPEVLLEGRVGPRADLYSLGVLLYRLVSGQYPVEGSDLQELLDRHRAGESRPLLDLRPDIPSDFVRVVERALNPDPAKRYGSAGAMERALVDAMQGLPDEDQVLDRKAASGTRRRVFGWMAGAFGAVLFAVAVSWMVNGGTRNPVTPTGHDVPAMSTVNAASMREEVASSAADTVVLRPEEAPVLVAAATLYRSRDGARLELAETDRIAPGDQLFVELEAGQQLFFYVLNEDENGELFALFPLEGLPLQNPLTAHHLHRLPATDRDWKVTSAGGNETFLLVASPERLADVEQMMSSLQAATEGRPIDNEGMGEVLRGVGGLAPTVREQGRLDALETGLRDRQQRGSIWMRRFEVRNPKS